jgi:uncharacterized membrane protein YkoI
MVVVGTIVGIALAAGGPVRAQGTQPTGQAQQGAQVQQPSYACSVKAPQDASDADLARLARITLARATRAAEAAVPGTALRSSLDNENGCVVYSVEIRSATGQIHDVKIDAGTAAVVHQETGPRLGPEFEGPGERENGAED